MKDKTAARLFGLFLVLVGIVIVIACSIPAKAQWLPIPEEIDTVLFGDEYMTVQMSLGQMPPYIINISDLEFIEAVYVDGSKVSLERIDPLASFIGGMFVGITVLALFSMLGGG